jgi:hypothetical protein
LREPAENDNQKALAGVPVIYSRPMPLSLVQRLLHSFTPRSAHFVASVPMAVLPPARRTTASWQRRLGDWLASSPAATTALDDWQPTGRKSAELVASRASFRAALDDIPTLQSGACLDSIRLARSMHELWHLRAEVFNLVSRNRSQAEATRRLALLDVHFPTRARRGGPRGATPIREGHESVPPL